MLSLLIRRTRDVPVGRAYRDSFYREPGDHATRDFQLRGDRDGVNPVDTRRTAADEL